MPLLKITPDTVLRLAAAGERLGIPDGAVVALLSHRAAKLTARDLAHLPPGTRGRRGQGRRPRKDNKSGIVLDTKPG